MTETIVIMSIIAVLTGLIPLMVWAVRAAKAPKRRKSGFDAVYAIFYAFSTPFERAPQQINESKSPERLKKQEAGDPPSDHAP